MSTSITKRPLATLQELLEQAKPTIAKSLAGSVLTSDRLIQIAFNCVSRTPDLQRCSRVSVIRALIQSAELGLEPGTALQEAWLIPYNNRKTGQMECQFQPGFRGLARLAIDEGTVLKIDCVPVYAKDTFDWNDKVLPPVPRHKPAPLDCKDPGPLIGVYCVAQLPGGGQKIEVMTRAQVDHIRGKSRAQSGPWETDFDEMAKKTVWKRMSKLLGIRPGSRLAKALEVEEAIDAGTMETLSLAPPEAVPEYTESDPVVAPPTSLSAVTANLNKKRAERPKESAKDPKPAIQVTSHPGTAPATAVYSTGSDTQLPWPEEEPPPGALESDKEGPDDDAA